MNQITIESYSCEVNDKNKCSLSHLWMYNAKSLLELNREEAIQVFNKIDTINFEAHVRNFSLMNYYKIGSDIQKHINPKLSASLKKSSLEIASKHQFKFFETIYA